VVAPSYDADALEVLKSKKNRIILVHREASLPSKQFRTILNGVLEQDKDLKTDAISEMKTATKSAPTQEQLVNLEFASKLCKNTKSNTIVLVKGKQLLASGVGQTSRVDALNQAIEKAKKLWF
jgi:phosphoribosylaminoimidazolecarboxamide formyltransferase/IMP cyclohydrolase